jgi:hypothetical protein
MCEYSASGGYLCKPKCEYSVSGGYYCNPNREHFATLTEKDTKIIKATKAKAKPIIQSRTCPPTWESYIYKDSNNVSSTLCKPMTILHEGECNDPMTPYKVPGEFKCTSEKPKSVCPKASPKKPTTPAPTPTKK